MSEQQVEQKRSTESFPFFKFSGTHREIGQQYGETCEELIRRHLELVRHRLRKNYNAPSSVVEDIALKYKPYVEKYAPFLAEEIVGMSEGAGISLGEAYLLQVRAEMNHHFMQHNECTTFAVDSKGTVDGSPLIGQNADLPEFYREIGVVIEFKPDHDPAHLMLTPAGQISYIGINDQGMGVFANYINCQGWRDGLPRYMFSRTALNTTSVKEAIEVLSNVYRGSARNVIMLDKHDHIVDLELTPTKVGKISAKNGYLAHTNHFISPDLLNEEQATGHKLTNSKLRLSRMNQLLEENYGNLSVEKMQEILRDRENYPNCICQVPGDELNQAPGEKTQDIITFASVIAEPSQGRMWIAIGPPNEYEYRCYEFSSK